MSNNTEHAPTLYPYLRYRDARAALAWLERAFGFASHFVVDDDDGKIAHAQMSFGTGIVMVGEAAGDTERSPLDLPAVPGGIYVFVEDVDAHHARAVEAGAEVTMPLRDTEYGSREYGAHDIEGHHWAFGTYRPVP